MALQPTCRISAYPSLEACGSSMPAWQRLPAAAGEALPPSTAATSEITGRQAQPQFATHAVVFAQTGTT